VSRLICLHRESAKKLTSHSSRSGCFSRMGTSTDLFLRLSFSTLTLSQSRQVTILHWGPNKLIYPFFSFADPSDPYTYRLTISASLVIWLAELFSSFLARLVCWLAYGIDVTNVSVSSGLPPVSEADSVKFGCAGRSQSIPRACRFLSLSCLARRSKLIQCETTARARRSLYMGIYSCSYGYPIVPISSLYTSSRSRTDTLVE